MSTNPVERAELEIAHQTDDPSSPTVVHPLTGEALDVCQAPDHVLARFLEDVREYERLLREAKTVVSREALSRMDRQASWTLHTENSYILKSSSPAPTEAFDELALRTDLLQLVDEGTLAPEAVDQAVEPIVTYKARKAGINALRKLGGPAKATIDRHASEVEKKRYVTVERAH